MKSPLFLVVIALLTFTSCTKDIIRGSGTVVMENRSLSNFTKVQTSGSSNVYITQGSSFKVEVRGYANLVAYFETRIINGTLELGFKNNVQITNDNIEVFVTIPLVDGLSLSGSGLIKASGIFPITPNMEMRISGSGSITIENGSSANLVTDISGSGDIKAFGFTASKADSQVSGSGNTEVTATSQLTAKISGSGNIYYKGTPAINTQISGSGAVIKR